MFSSSIPSGNNIVVLAAYQAAVSVGLILPVFPLSLLLPNQPYQSMALRLLVQVQDLFQQGDVFQWLSALPSPKTFLKWASLLCCLYLLPVVKDIQVTPLKSLPCTISSESKAGASVHLSYLLNRDRDEACQYRHPEVFKMLFSLCGCPFKPHLCQAFRYTLMLLLLKSAFPTVMFAELAWQHGCDPLAK